jgi:HD-like signal output (HDOD) protein
MNSDATANPAFESTDDADRWILETGPASESFAFQLADVDGLRTFPVVAGKALNTLSNPDFKVVEVTDIIKKDPSLASGVLRMANSAFFAGSKAVSSIHHAFVRLGRQSVQEVIAAVATMDLFPDTDGIGKRFRDHLAATAAIAQTLAREFASNRVEGVFLSGLLHDVGKMLLIESGEFDYSMEPPEMFRPDRMQGEEESLLGFDHAQLGGWVLHCWKIPSPIPWAVAWHHKPETAYADNRIGPLVAMLRLADQIDFFATQTPDDLAAQITGLDGSKDLAYANLTPEMLLDVMDNLLEARVKSLALFGG